MENGYKKYISAAACALLCVGEVQCAVSSTYPRGEELRRTNSWRKSLVAPLILRGGFFDLFRGRESPKDKQSVSPRISMVQSELLKEMNTCTRPSDGYGLVNLWGIQQSRVLAKLPKDARELSEALEGETTLVIHGNILSRDPSQQVALLNQLKECSEHGELTLKNLIIIDTALKYANLSWLWENKFLEGVYFIKIKGFQDGVFKNLRDSSLRTVCFGRCQITPDDARDIAPALQKIQDFRLDSYISLDVGTEMEVMNVIADGLMRSKTLKRFSVKGSSNVLAIQRLLTAAANNILSGGMLESFEMLPFIGKLGGISPNPLSILQYIVPFHVDASPHVYTLDDLSLSPGKAVEKAIELKILSEEQRMLATSMAELAFARRRVAAQQKYAERRNITGEDLDRFMEPVHQEELSSRLNFEKQKRKAIAAKSAVVEEKKTHHHRKKNK